MVSDNQLIDTPRKRRKVYKKCNTMSYVSKYKLLQFCTGLLETKLLLASWVHFFSPHIHFSVLNGTVTNVQSQSLGYQSWLLGQLYVKCHSNQEGCADRSGILCIINVKLKWYTWQLPANRFFSNEVIRLNQKIALEYQGSCFILGEA